MIENPFAQKEIRFYDWDDTLIGVLSLPNVAADMREFVNFFVEVNFIHPDLRVKNYIDPWAAERGACRADAEGRYPERPIYPHEGWKILPTEAGEWEVTHFLRFCPAPRKERRK